MEKKEKMKKFAAGMGKAARGLRDSVVRAVDQNDDGKFDLTDVSAMASAVGNTVKKGTAAIKNTADEKAREMELKALQPIFQDTLDQADFMLPKFICVEPRDKKYSENELCEGSIGHESTVKGNPLVTIFQDSVDSFGIKLFPDDDSVFYLVDPSDRNTYISLDEYFNYLKLARINELQKIAQDLGAKHFKVTYKEEQTCFTQKKVKAKAEAKSIAQVEGEHVSAQTKYSTVEVAAEMSFPGHAPIRPTLKYLQRDPSIQNLIEMRMDEHAPLLNHKFMIKLSNSSGIKENDAAKIDAVLKGMKYSCNTTVASEAKNESRRYLDYEVDFE